MPSPVTANPIVVVIEFHLPAYSLPFRTWQELKDEARTALSRNHHEPGATELSLQATDGRSVGYVICKAHEDAALIYDYFKKKYAVTHNARVHWFDANRSNHTVKCNCDGGHQIGGHDSAYIKYARYVVAHDPARYIAAQSPVLYVQPVGWTPASSASNPVYALANGMSGLAVAPVHYAQPVPFSSEIPTTYDRGCRLGSTYAVQGHNAPSAYAQYAQYPPSYAVNVQTYPEQTNTTKSCFQHQQHSSGYVESTQGYAGHITATVTHGQASSSASYGVNASGQLVNTTQGCLQTELNRLVMRNLDPKTAEKELRKEIEKAANPAIIPEYVKLNKYENIKKKSISAIATFRNYHDANKVKEYFETAPRHIRNRQVAVSWGKESAPPPPPMVLSSTNPN